MDGGRAGVSPIGWRGLNPYKHKWVWETLPWRAQSCNQFVLVPATDNLSGKKQIQFTLPAILIGEKHKKQLYCSMASRQGCYSKYYIYARPPVVEKLHISKTPAPAPIARLLFHAVRLVGRHDRHFFFPLGQLRLARLWKCNGYQNEIGKPRTPEMIELNAFVGFFGEICSFCGSRVEVGTPSTRKYVISLYI